VPDDRDALARILHGLTTGAPLTPETCAICSTTLSRADEILAAGFFRHRHMDEDAVLGLTDEDAETAVFVALGAASMCWATIDLAGEFESVRCEQIGTELIAHLRRLRLMPDVRPNRKSSD
jgi:hypothetical protein